MVQVGQAERAEFKVHKDQEGKYYRHRSHPDHARPHADHPVMRAEQAGRPARPTHPEPAAPRRVYRQRGHAR
jgi:hypothetical protein